MNNTIVLLFRTYVGELDDATIDLLNTPRCGNADVMEFRVSFNIWSKTDLTYCVNTTYRDLSQDVQRRVIRQAWDVSRNVSRLILF